MKLRILAEAQIEAGEAAAWYERQRSGLGDEFLDELQNALDRISAGDEDLPIYEFSWSTNEVRRCRLKRFPFAVILTRSSEEASVIAVIHLRRRPMYWVSRLRSS